MGVSHSLKGESNFLLVYEKQMLKNIIFYM